MNICENCDYKILDKSKDLFNEFVSKNLLNISEKYKLDSNLWMNVFEYLINFDGHEIVHTKKSRIKPEHMDYDSDGEYYWKESKFVCTICFQNGILESLKNQKRLPYTRRDIYYFIEQDFEQTNEMFFMDYSFPNKYIIDFYRQEIPKKINKIYLIDTE